MKVVSFLIHLAVLNSGTSLTIDELEEKVHIVHAHQGRQAKILLELLGLDEFENEKVDIVEPVIYDEEDFQDLDMINEDIFNKNKDDGKTRSLLGVFPFNNLTNSDHHAEHHHHDHDQHNLEEEDPDDHNNHHEELGALGVFPFNNFTNPDPDGEHHHHDQDHDHDQHNHEEEEEDQQHNHHEENDHHNHHEEHDHHNHHEEHDHHNHHEEHDHHNHHEEHDHHNHHEEHDHHNHHDPHYHHNHHEEHDHHNHHEENDHHNHHEENDHHNHHEENDHEHEETSDVGDPVTALRTPLSNRTQDVFPFNLGVKSNDDTQDTSSFSISQFPQQINSVGVSDGKGKKCVDKVMFVEETVYEEVQTCIHDYDRRCHISYVTTYQAQQVEECEENFRKECSVSFEVQAYNESIEVCHSPLVKDCSLPGPKVCRTEYETWCATRQLVHEVEEDVSECREEEEERCKDVTEGYTTKTRCDKWPVTRCEVKKQTNTKHTPETKCIKEPREVCAPEGCTMKEGPVECHNEIKTVVVDQPIESCDLEPIKTCGHVTKLFPVLTPSEECSDVPKEICVMSRINPTKKKRPVIKKWCYVPSKESGLL